MQVERITRSDFGASCLAPLLELTDCPDVLSLQGVLPDPNIAMLTVVGSRTPTPYAKRALEHIMAGLAGQSVCIVSGLALGIDCLAHSLALQHGLATMAFPGSGLAADTLYPASNRTLGQEIVANGGVLVSEFADTQKAAVLTFPKRNRLMARVARLVLVVEAAEKSGTLITARNASEYSVDVAVIPGLIFNEQARGSNALVRQGAQVVSSSDDVMESLGITKVSQREVELDDIGEDEACILACLVEPKSRDSLAEVSGFDAVRLATTISLLEIKGYVQEQVGLIYKL